MSRARSRLGNRLRQIDSRRMAVASPRMLPVSVSASVDAEVTTPDAAHVDALAAELMRRERQAA